MLAIDGFGADDRVLLAQLQDLAAERDQLRVTVTRLQQRLTLTERPLALAEANARTAWRFAGWAGPRAAAGRGGGS